MLKFQIFAFLFVFNILAVDLSSSADSYFKEGMLMVRDEQYRSAIKLFAEALKRDKKRADIYLNIGACYERLNKFKTGIPFYQRAIKLAPSNPQYNFLFGKVLIRNGKIDKGVKYLEKAARLDPDNANYLYALGVGYVALNRYDLAEPAFARAAKYAGNNSFVWYNLGLSQYRIGKTNQAYHAFKQIEIDSPIASEKYYHLANIDFQNKNYVSSLKNVKMSMALDPNSRQSKKLIAGIFICTGNYREGIKILEYLQKKHLDNVLNFEIAAAYQKWAEKALANRKYEIAIDKFKQASRYIPETDKIKKGIAECEKKLKKNSSE